MICGNCLEANVTRITEPRFVTYACTCGRARKQKIGREVQPHPNYSASPAQVEAMLLGPRPKREESKDDRFSYRPQAISVEQRRENDRITARLKKRRAPL